MVLARIFETRKYEVGIYGYETCGNTVITATIEIMELELNYLRFVSIVHLCLLTKDRCEGRGNHAHETDHVLLSMLPSSIHKALLWEMLYRVIILWPYVQLGSLCENPSLYDMLCLAERVDSTLPNFLLTTLRKLDSPEVRKSYREYEPPRKFNLLGASGPPRLQITPKMGLSTTNLCICCCGKHPTEAQAYLITA